MESESFFFCGSRGFSRWLVIMVSSQDLELWDPVHSSLFMAYKWGDPNYLLSGGPSSK